MQAQRITVGNIELQIEDHESQGDAILFLHFSGANLKMWAPAVPHFQDHYRLILVDLRGHGRSGRPAAGYHIDQIAGDIVGVMDHLGLGRAHIVGSSLGAEVGLSLAANHPGRVISLVCDGPPVSEFGPYSTWEGTEAEFLEHAAGQVDKLRAASETVYPSSDTMIAARRELFEKQMGWNRHLEAMERYAIVELDDGRYVQAFGKRALADYLDHYFHTRFEDYYRRVTCPLLLIAEGEAQVDEGERAAIEALRALAAKARVVYLSGWDHPYGWLFDPEGICRTILRFLSPAGS